MIQTEVSSTSQAMSAYKIYAPTRILRVLRYAVANMLVRTRTTQINWLDNIRTVLYLLSARPWFIRYPGWLIIPGMYITAWLQYLPSYLITLLFIVLYIPLSLLWLLLAFIGIMLLSIYHLLSTRVTHVALHCPYCYSALRQPIYLCPGCNAEHPALHPGSYGVFVQRCKRCQTRLPTLDRLGRKRLKRVCSSCRRPLSPLLGTGVPVHIPLIGGPATGKTSLLTYALANIDQQSVGASSSPFPVTFLASEQEQVIVTQWQQMVQGKELIPIKAITPPALVINVKRAIPRHIYFYDPSGETFLVSEYMQQHTYYSHASGFILVIDPTTIPAFCRRRGEEPMSKILPPGNHSLPCIYERFMQVFESRAGLSTKRRYTQPVAVVVTKVDCLHLEKEIGRSAAHQLIAQRPGIMTEAEATHELVRAFLCDYELENVIRDLEAHFTQVRYFTGAYPADRNSQSIHSNLLPWLLGQAGAF